MQTGWASILIRGKQPLERPHPRSSWELDLRRIGIGQSARLPRSGLFLAGAVLLFGYGLSLNLAPIEFNRVVGLYVATLFVVWQVANLIVFRTLPDMPILFGGALIIAGGLIVSFWK
jgi:hypothetical protein